METQDSNPASNNRTSLNIYLSKEQKQQLEREAKSRALSLSSFLKSAAFEKIKRERVVIN
ncbi:MAG: hypothetical protein QY331_09095 [Melioribacteraceae bacterium]|nr:MAG: hypothetical protein QY331_09095 [Melioribacteraceae bacterium]